MKQSDEILTLNEACQLLRVSKPTLVKLLNSGKIKGFKVGTRIWKIAMSEISAYIDGFEESAK